VISLLNKNRYCKRTYQPGTETSGVFLTLLRLYLRPTVKSDLDLLRPALDLISRHSARLGSAETLKLLPPLVTARDVREFLLESLRAPQFDTKVIREVSKARNEQVSRKLAALQTRRVKVTDSRMLVFVYHFHTSVVDRDFLQMSSVP
jgi:Vam6/Vps39-like protein vacuolar protein sorting-associated protein 39